MQENLEEIVTLAEIADIVEVSRRQLERIFKTYTGMTPKKYYTDLRLARAYALFSETNMSVVEVAMATGFGDALQPVAPVSRQIRQFPQHLQEKLGRHRTRRTNGAALTGPRRPLFAVGHPDVLDLGRRVAGRRAPRPRRRSSRAPRPLLTQVRLRLPAEASRSRRTDRSTRSDQTASTSRWPASVRRQFGMRAGQDVHHARRARPRFRAPGRNPSPPAGRARTATRITAVAHRDRRAPSATRAPAAAPRRGKARRSRRRVRSSPAPRRGSARRAPAPSYLSAQAA